MRDVAVERGVFTPEQIVRLLDKAEGDFKGLILAGYYTGARLLDLARLTWGNVDLAERSISFIRKKAAVKLKVPIHPELFDYLLSRSVPDDGRKLLFPQLYHFVEPARPGFPVRFAG